jgi:hypothetical protein
MSTHDTVAVFPMFVMSRPGRDGPARTTWHRSGASELVTANQCVAAGLAGERTHQCIRRSVSCPPLPQ